MAKTVKRRKSRANTKAAKIRAYAKRHPEAGPTAISKALTKRGVKVSAAQVSNVRASDAKKAAGASGEASNGAPARRGRKPGPGDAVSLSRLVEARKFADSVGGVEKAGQLLDALAKLR